MKSQRSDGKINNTTQSSADIIAARKKKKSSKKSKAKKYGQPQASNSVDTLKSSRENSASSSRSRQQQQPQQPQPQQEEKQQQPQHVYETSSINSSVNDSKPDIKNTDSNNNRQMNADRYVIFFSRSISYNFEETLSRKKKELSRLFTSSPKVTGLQKNGLGKVENV